MRGRELGRRKKLAWGNVRKGRMRVVLMGDGAQEPIDRLMVLLADL